MLIALDTLLLAVIIAALGGIAHFLLNTIQDIFRGQNGITHSLFILFLALAGMSLWAVVDVMVIYKPPIFGATSFIELPPDSLIYDYYGLVMRLAMFVIFIIFLIGLIMLRRAMNKATYGNPNPPEE